jgi:hypothetical protein
MELDNPTNLNLEPQANRYTLTDSEGMTQIVYFPNLSLTLDAPSTIPQLYYRGSEGEFTFTQTDIEHQHSRLGQLITVILALSPGIPPGQLEFTLILPQINLAGQREREFTTIGIRTLKKPDSSPHPAGAALTYEGFALRGVAEIISAPT